MSTVFQSVLPRRNPQKEAAEAFSRLPNYPHNQTTWKGFLEYCNQLPKGRPFSITLRKGPERSVVSLYIPMAHPDHTFFGLIHPRNDGKLGRLCFGRESADFVQEYDPSRLSIFSSDGLERKFLRVPEGSYFELGSMFKVVNFDSDPRSVTAHLALAIRGMIGDAKLTPRNEVEGASLAKVRREVLAFLDECCPFGNTDDVMSALEVAKKRIDLRTALLRDESDKLVRRLTEIRSEVENLGRISLKEPPDVPSIP